MQATIILALACVFAAASQASYIDYEALEAAESDYYPYNERIPYPVQANRQACVPWRGSCNHNNPCCPYGICRREACVGRGGGCDHSASACCSNTVCRCNLFGTNCKCTRKGLFSKAG